MILSDIIKSSHESTTSLQNVSSDKAHRHYISKFIQRTPYFGIKHQGQWTINRDDFVDEYIFEHLYGVNRTGIQRHIIGTIAQWYPKFAILDADDCQDIQSIRRIFGVDDESSSITFETSDNSYHVLFKPQYDGKPLTVKLLHQILGKHATSQKVELYPQEKRVVRAPYHVGCKVIRSEQISDVVDFLKTFDELSPLELKALNQLTMLQNHIFSSNTSTFKLPTKGVMKQGYDLYMDGLSEPNSRFESQHKVAIYLWRQNLTPKQALDELMSWVVTKHNGYSKDAASINYGSFSVLKQVRKEHKCLVDHIWSNFERQSIYPDSTHNDYHGWLTKEDLLTAIKLSNSSIPQFKFLAQLIAYFNAYGKTRLSIHRNRLIEWSSHKTYLRHIENLEARGILTRDSQYQVGKFAKAIKLNFRPSFQDITQSLSDDNRVLSLEESLAKIGRSDSYEMFVQHGFTRQQAYQYLNRILEG